MAEDARNADVPATRKAQFSAGIRDIFLAGLRQDLAIVREPCLQVPSGASEVVIWLTTFGVNFGAVADPGQCTRPGCLVGG